jgi:hypothetical protein
MTPAYVDQITKTQYFSEPIKERADETNMTKSTNFDTQADDIILSWSSM